MFLSVVLLSVGTLGIIEKKFKPTIPLTTVLIHNLLNFKKIPNRSSETAV